MNIFRNMNNDFTIFKDDKNSGRRHVILIITPHTYIWKPNTAI